MGQLITSCRVLVVDDNRDAAESVADLLTALGHTAMTAFGGAECLALLPRFTPDLILMDINMPQMNGYHTVSAIRQLTARQLRIVALTSWTGEDVQSRMIEVGFDGYLRKPASINELLREAQAGYDQSRK